MYQKKQPLFPELPPLDSPRERRERGGRDAGDAMPRERRERKEGANGIEEGFLRYYLAVGRLDHVSPKDIVGAIAGEGNISSSLIGRIKLFNKFSTVELPDSLSQEVLEHLSEMTIRGNDARFRVMTDEPPTGPAPGTRPRESRGFHRGKKFESERPHENRKARRARQFADRKPGQFDDKPFREKSGDKPFRKTRRFGRH